MPKLADKSIRISFRTVVVTNVKEFPGDLYGVAKHKIIPGKVAKVFFGAVAECHECPRQAVVPLICIVLVS